MRCPRCGCPYPDSAPSCPFCGLVRPVEKLHPLASNPKHKWIPIGLMTAMMFIGILLFVLIPMTQQSSAADVGANYVQPSLSQEGYFEVVNGVLYFDQSRYSADPVLVIPDTINGQTVSVIGSGCFENTTGITTIILPESITRIDDRAFSDCSDLRGLRISEGVTAIGAEAFSGCESLEAVYIPTAVNSVGEGAFQDCPALVYVFYGGFYAELYHMYPEVITPFTWAICLDGEYQYAAQ